jgi:hypothetical protein
MEGPPKSESNIQQVTNLGGIADEFPLRKLDHNPVLWSGSTSIGVPPVDGITVFVNITVGRYLPSFQGQGHIPLHVLCVQDNIAEAGIDIYIPASDAIAMFYNMFTISFTATLSLVIRNVPCIRIQDLQDESTEYR